MTVHSIHEEASPATSVGNASVDTTPGLRQKVVFDRRISPRNHPRLLKQFREWIDGENIT